MDSIFHLLGKVCALCLSWVTMGAFDADTELSSLPFCLKEKKMQ
jgi:hypothetical protein